VSFESVSFYIVVKELYTLKQSNPLLIYYGSNFQMHLYVYKLIYNLITLPLSLHEIQGEVG
jgi:hypothetical protein